MSIGEIENTETNRIRELIREETNPAQRGVITKVYNHIEKDDFSNHEAKVVSIEGDETLAERAPILTSVPNLVSPPRLDLKKVPHAIVQYIGDHHRPVITHWAYVYPDNRAVKAEKGDVRLRRDDTYLEMKHDGDYARFAVKEEEHDENMPPQYRMGVNWNEDDREDPILRMTRDDDKDEIIDHEIAIDGETPEIYMKVDHDDDEEIDYKLGINSDDGRAYIDVDTNDDGDIDHRLGIDYDGRAFLETDKNADGTMDHNIGIDQNGRVYLEADPNGDGSPEKIVEINDSGDVIAGDTGGAQVVVTSGGQVQLGSGTFKRVARKGDEVQITDENGNTLTGEITEGSSDVESS